MTMLRYPMPLLALLAVFALGAGTLQAREVRVLVWKSQPDMRFFIGQKDRLVALDPVSPQYKSGLFEVPTGGEAGPQLFEQPSGTPEPVAVQALDLSGFDLPLILILPGGSFEGLESTRAMVLEDSRAAFAFGTYHFVNLTRQDLFVELGGTRQRISGGDRAVIAPDEDDLSNMGIRIAYREEAGARFVASSIVLHRPDNRSLLLFYPDQGPRGPMIRFKAVSEFASEYKRTVGSAGD